MVSFQSEIYKCLEKVQCVFTKHIDLIHDLPYTARLKSLQIYSLKKNIYMAIYMWKILEGKVHNFSPPIECHIISSQEYTDVNQVGRYQNTGLVYSVVPTGHLGTLCHNSSRSRAATLFNCLQKLIRNRVNCANTSISKRALDYHLCSTEYSPMVSTSATVSTLCPRK